ncbi:hypothetical protein [Aliidiomarina soli]|uniref:Uncharacterized protein n=1 Tax=Aliidiomarina soli TaxID=1928574 RepID=A0A432WDX8_9GAMM|nr:hypothetical protein [Aliidiomarina soli]RUO31081.1 hypothetical protein CWE14_11300 [Aliidiomarina soli]
MIRRAHFLATPKEVGFSEALLNEILDDFASRTEQVISRVAKNLPKDLPAFIFELPMHFAQGDGGFHQLEPAVIFLPNAEMLQLTMQGRVIDVRNAPALADMRDPIERRATFSFWSQSPMTTMDALKNMHDLDLQFGQSVIQSPAGWILDPDSTNEHLRIIF